MSSEIKMIPPFKLLQYNPVLLRRIKDYRLSSSQNQLHEKMKNTKGVQNIMVKLHSKLTIVAIVDKAF